MQVQSGNTERLVGQGIKRLEDPKLIVGAGKYLEDLRIPHMADIAIVHSPYAHARIKSIDTSAALEMPGVVAVITSEDIPDAGSLPVGGDLKVPSHPPLARDKVRFVGEPVAAVVAESREQAIEGAEAVVVDYEPLQAVVDAAAALEEGAPLIYEEFGDNVCMRRELLVGEPDAEFAKAEHTLKVHVGHGRIAALPIETRGGIASYDEEADQYTLWLSTQAAWLERSDISHALGIEEQRLHVITPDVGGAFGGKICAYPESVMLLAIAKRVGRPVRWIATRSEDLQTSQHGREMYTDGEIAFDSDGTIRAVRLKTIGNVGAFLMKYSGGHGARMLTFATGCYTIRHLHSELINAFTNTGPMGPYRGAGRPEATFFIERAISDVAAYLGMDQAEIRRKNFIPADAFPYATASNVVYDSGNYELTLDRALEAIDYDNLKREIAERRERGEIVGVGLASCVESSGGGGENGMVSWHKDGKIIAYTGTSPHGQGLATSFAQIVSDELGVPVDKVTVNYGDTSVGVRGGGTMGSRSLQLGGSALREAAQEVRDVIVRQAARMLEASVDDLVLQDGQVYPAGVPERGIAAQEVVERYLTAQETDESKMEGGFDAIEASSDFRASSESFPFGTTIAVVSIDRESGRPKIERYVSVDDFGNVVNPVLVEGQLLGGAVQGFGETLWERVAYDPDNGQLLSGSLMDYAAPRASQVPTMEFDRTVTPSPVNPLGAKGVGEAGTVHAAPAVTNAVMDALRPFNVEPLDLPLTEEKLWRVITFGGAGIR